MLNTTGSWPGRTRRLSENVFFSRFFVVLRNKSFNIKQMTVDIFQKSLD